MREEGRSVERVWGRARGGRGGGEGGRRGGERRGGEMRKRGEEIGGGERRGGEMRKRGEEIGGAVKRTSMKHVTGQISSRCFINGERATTS